MPMVAIITKMKSPVSSEMAVWTGASKGSLRYAVT